MYTVVSPSTVPLSVKSSTYSHRTLSPIPALQTAIMSGASPSGDLIPNGTKINLDPRDGTNIALALDLDARQSSTDLVVDDEMPRRECEGRGCDQGGQERWCGGERWGVGRRAGGGAAIELRLWCL